MKSKEDELLSVQYRIEKSGMKQQKLENRLVSLSKELKKSKRNSLLFMMFFLLAILIMGIGMFYVSRDDVESSVNEETNTYIEEIKKNNDSLREELNKLKSDIIEYKNRFGDTTGVISDSSLIKKDTITNSFDEKKIEKKYERRHAIVKKVFRSNGVVFIEADFVEYFEGKNAVKKAKEYGKAEYDINDAGDTVYFLYNNYYVNNINTKLRTLELDENVVIRSVNKISKGFPLTAFQKIIKDNPIMILEMKDGIVYKITKQKLL